MVQELTRAEYLRALRQPRPRFQKLVVTASGLALRHRMPSPCYWFERSDIGEEHGTGRYLRIPDLGTISLVVDGKASAFFYLAGRRVDTCTFAYDLSAPQLAKTVVAMRRAGLGRFIVPAAEWALREMPAVRRPVLRGSLRSLVPHRRKRNVLGTRRRRTKS
jgi:hypothetical protein